MTGARNWRQTDPARCLSCEWLGHDQSRNARFVLAAIVRAPGLLHAVRPIKGDRRFIAGVNFQREALGSGKTSLDFSKEIAADAKTLAFGPDIKLVQGDHMGSRSVTGEGHAANLLAVVGNQKLTIRPGKRCLDRSLGMPVGDDLLDLPCTACGLALPPVAFITWPTNQPASLGLALACSTLSGLAAITSSTAASMAPVSVTCFMPRFSTIWPGRRLLPDDLEQVLGDLAGDGAVLDHVDDGAELLGRNRRVAMPCLPCSGAEQLVDDPVGGHLAVAALGDFLEIVGDRLFGDQHRGVVGVRPIST
jgi:hypothetical protein